MLLIYVDAHDVSRIVLPFSDIHINAGLADAVCFRTRPSIIYADRSQMFDYNISTIYMWKHWNILFTFELYRRSTVDGDVCLSLCLFIYFQIYEWMNEWKETVRYEYMLIWCWILFSFIVDMRRQEIAVKWTGCICDQVEFGWLILFCSDFKWCGIMWGCTQTIEKRYSWSSEIMAGSVDWRRNRPLSLRVTEVFFVSAGFMDPGERYKRNRLRLENVAISNFPVVQNELF